MRFFLKRIEIVNKPLITEARSLISGKEDGYNFEQLIFLRALNCITNSRGNHESTN